MRLPLENALLTLSAISQATWKDREEKTKS
jgi:hypothetical protein